MGTRTQVFENPQHDYTRKLMDAVPVANADRERRLFIPNEGELPSPVKPLDYAPPLSIRREVGNGHVVCHEAKVA